MQAVIMAGGRGTRLSSITRDIPKPMVQIDGKPLLEHQIDNLKECGITDVILVTGYLGDVIEDYFGDGREISPSTEKPFGVNISYYSEEIPLGTAGALGKIIDRLQENFILVFGDLFTCIDYRRFIEFHKDKKADATLFVHPNSHPYDSDIVITNSDKRVIGWSYKNTERKEFYKNLVNSGIYILDRKIAEYVSEIQHGGKEKVDLEKDILTKLLDDKDYKIYGYQSSEYVKDLGTPERLEAVKKDYFSGTCRKKNLLNKQKCIFLDRDGTINKYVGFLRSAEQMELVPTATEAIRKINGSEYLAVIVTNQPVIARGECSFEELEKIHNKMSTLLGSEGAYIDGLYFCPHHPDSGFDGEVKELKTDCDCRKPKTGLLKKAADDLNIDLSRSWLVGDTYQDIRTGTDAGMKTVLLKSGAENKLNKYQCDPDYTAHNLNEAIGIILNQTKGNDLCHTTR